MSRLQAWAVESRFRYALVWGGVNAAAVTSVVILVAVLGDGPAVYAVQLAVFGLVLSVFAQGLIWYPSQRRKRDRPRAGRAVGHTQGL